MEERRIQTYKEVAGKDLASEMDTNKEYRGHDSQMTRHIKAINGTKENVRTKANELVKLMNSTRPRSINIGIFVEKIPHAMEIFLAKLNRVCIFTVPKYYLEAAFGYKEEDGKLESTDSYVARLTLHMKLYKALIQTKVDGIRNLHGIEEGWKWVARFLNVVLCNST